MFAVIRERAAKSGPQSEHMDEFRRIRANLAGYKGTLEAATDDGRTMIVALWETPEHATAAAARLETEGRRLNGPQWSGPPRVIGQGEVSYDDLTRTGAAPAR